MPSPFVTDQAIAKALGSQLIHHLGVWFVQIANNFGANHEYTEEQKASFHKDPAELVKHAKSIEDQVNGLYVQSIQKFVLDTDIVYQAGACSTKTHRHKRKAKKQ